MRRLSNTFKEALGISGDSSDGGVSEAANPAAAESPPMNTSTATPHETPAQLRTSSSSPSSVSATATSSSSADTADLNANGAASAEANKLPPNWEEVEHPDTKQIYYWNAITNETTWNFPQSVQEDPLPKVMHMRYRLA